MSAATATARSGVRSTSTSSRHEARSRSANAQAWPTDPTPTMPTLCTRLPRLDPLPDAVPVCGRPAEARVDRHRSADGTRDARDQRLALPLLLLVEEHVAVV